jgi:hypothetical protein
VAKHVIVPDATQSDGSPAGCGDVSGAFGQKLQGGVEIALGHRNERITTVFPGIEHFNAACSFLSGMRRGVHFHNSDSGWPKRNNWSVAPTNHAVKELARRLSTDNRNVPLVTT